MKKQNPTVLAREQIAQTRVFTIESCHLRFSNGEERVFERMRAKGRGSVIVLALRDPETVLLIREYATGLDSYQLALPKGLIDVGESAEQAANREIMEELGYGAHRLRFLKNLAFAPSYHESVMQLWLAEELYEQRLPGDEPECLEVVPWSLNDLPALLARPDFIDARSIAALLYYQGGYATTAFESQEDNG